MRRSRDLRAPIAGAVIVSILIVGAVLRGAIGDFTSRVDGKGGTVQRDSAPVAIEEQFRTAVGLLHTRHYVPATQQFGELVKRAPWMPEAETNLAFALMGLHRFEEAQAHFERALALNDRQLNAYYGLAISREKQGDTDSALGAMRVYVHLAEADDPYLRKAWAAIWEWESTRNIKIKTASP